MPVLIKVLLALLYCVIYLETVVYYLAGWLYSWLVISQERTLWIPLSERGVVAGAFVTVRKL